MEVTLIRNTVHFGVPKKKIIYYPKQKPIVPHPTGSKNPQINIYQVQLSNHAAYRSLYFIRNTSLSIITN